MKDPAIKTKQFAHQREVYLEQRDRLYYALLWEMGLGKSKMFIDVASHHYFNGKIDQLLIISPGAVCTNWTRHDDTEPGELQLHMAAPYAVMLNPSASNAKTQVAREYWLDQRLARDKLRVLVMSFDSLITKHGVIFAEAAVKVFRTMIVVDESTAIKNHTAKTTQYIKRIGKFCHFRWIATGTPVAQSPFDIHSQIQFLNPDFWRAHGLNTYEAFKTEFATFRKAYFGTNAVLKVDSYRNLDKLHEIISRCSSRLLKEDSGVELPPKMYSLRTFEMTPEQTHAYSELKNEFMCEFGDGAIVEAPLAITRLIRFRQITSGFVTTTDWSDPDSGGQKEIRYLIPDEKNPRIQLLKHLIGECSHKVIVWCTLRSEVDQICRVLQGQCVRYDGLVKDREREIALHRFRDPSDNGAQVLVANMAAISHGVTLTIAKTAIYYSNDYRLERRQQSEDRNHRIGQDQSIHIIDIAAAGTVDIKVIRALRSKFDIASQVTNDRLREWISGD